MTFIQLLAMVGSSVGKPNICCDSRKVAAGDCFVAVPGVKNDGHDFIPQALKRGAAYIVAERPVPADAAKLIIVADSAEALALLAQAWYGRPSAKLTNLAVTGTNGKTTVTWLVRSVVRATGKGCGLIGTIIWDTGSDASDSVMTTPGPLEIAALARRMLDCGAGYMAIEASSHALSQKRLAAIDFTAAAFTNLTGDHLDYHGTVEDYLAAKTTLFTNLPVHATAVLNAQSAVCEKIARRTKVRILRYAVDEPSDITALIESMNTAGTVFKLIFGAMKTTVRTPLVGRHNIENHLAAAGLCLAAGFDLEAVGAGLSALTGVPGRLEPVDCGQDFAVLVDYAHTDDALKNVLSTLRPLCRNRLTVVFGCGGDRDKSKRPRMANVAEKLADIVYVTSDNPRTEEPSAIIEEILSGFSERGSRKVTVEPDRKRAIELALAAAKCGDTVLIAGKGHENYQIIGDKKFNFSDQLVTRCFLELIK